MKYSALLLALAIGFISAVSASAANLQDRISEAVDILSARQHGGHPIPESILKNAKGVAIVKVSQGGLVFGGIGGQGILVTRKPSLLGSGWSAPSAFNLSGGTFGAQIGFQTKRYVMVINSEKALRLFTTEGSEVKWDGTAAGTAGATQLKETNSQLAKLPIIYYQDVDGVFGGATLGGTTVAVADDANQGYYGPNVWVNDILTGKVKAPASSKALYDVLNGK
ncbi:MAG: lipid-binding SYLF domain-containing protein [Verrucomicrobium sp.]|nr:lipid-binding SYLF domain-containing protein [Verrucomicrobium sp.]